MADLPQGRGPSQRTTRPLLLATTGIALVKMASGCLISGNLIAPPPCDDNPTHDPYCEPGPDAGVDGGLDAGGDGGTGDGGTADGGR